MNIKELTDEELSLAIGKAILPEHEWRDWTDASWDEFMPLALDCNISVTPLLEPSGERAGDYRVNLCDWGFSIYADSDNPLRALKECLLLALQEVK
ncbi:MAG: hypothetical protein GY810_32315 [Aureispira sp.]|nr:hypothetical protein [Aureispira sp.]